MVAPLFSFMNMVAAIDIITSSEAHDKETFKLNASAMAPKINPLNPPITNETPSEKPDISPMFDGERSCAITCANVIGASKKKPAMEKNIKLDVPARNRNPNISGK
jgi:hypothetical protein